jgi:hypothetical protein
MDCQALLKHSHAIKSPSLSNATLHFISTQLFGPNYFQHLVQDAKPDDIPIEQRLHMFLPLLSCNLNAYKKKAQDVDGHLCKSAAEFLLNPWLLIQLPWNAALLNQWLMAALAEVFKVKKEVIKFHWWPLGREVLMTVNAVLTEVEVLHHRLVTGIAYIGRCNKSTTAPEVSREILTQLVLPVMPALEMLANNTLLNTIEAVKKYAWPMEGKPQIFFPEAYGGTSNSLGSIHEHRSAYGQTFWITCDSSFAMFNYIQSESLEGLRTYYECLQGGCRIEFSEILEMYETNVKSIPDGHVVSHLENVWRTNKKEIIETVKAIATKTIGGDYKFDQFSFAKNRNYLLLASNFIDFKIQTDFVKGVELNETSAILNINHLQAEFDLADIEAKIGGLVYSALKRDGRRVYITCRRPALQRGQ